MTPEQPRPDDLEAQLRDALRANPSSPHDGADALLRTVHRRASRRRASRRAAGTVLVLAGVAGAGAAVTSWPQRTVPAASTPEYVSTPTVSMTRTAMSPATRAPTTTRTKAAPTTATAVPSTPPGPVRSAQPGERVRPADVDVSSVTAVRRASFWVLGTGKCQQGACNVIAHTDDAGQTFDFRTAPQPSPAPATTTAPPTPPSAAPEIAGPTGAEVELRYAVNGTDAWGFGGEVWSTHDAGHSWAQVELPVDAAVTSVQAWGDTAWAFGTTPEGSPVAFSSPVGADRWTPADLGLSSTDRVDTVVVADGVVGAVVTHADGSLGFLRSRDTGATWEEVPPPEGCLAPLASSAVEGAVWLYCSGAADAVVAVTTDAGATWSAQVLAAPTSTLTTMTGIDTRHALVTDATALSIVTVDGPQASGVEPVSGAYSPDDDVWSDVGYTYAGFPDPLTGYLVTSGGELARSADGGRTWTPVELP